MTASMRHLVIVLGDQLDAGSTALAGFDVAQDAVWMCEAPAEATHAWSHKARIAIFLSAMRHFRDQLRARGYRIHYETTGEHASATIAEALAARLADSRPRRVIVVEPGEWRLREDISRVCAETRTGLDIREDGHFFCPTSRFSSWMRTRHRPRMEDFYRWQRTLTGLLMEGAEPAGGRWNYDQDNRRSFGRQGPGFVPRPPRFPPDPTTRAVLDLVASRYADHPGTLESFDWPVTRADALQALEDFVRHRLADFGHWQDAMWDTEGTLWHSRLSAALNLKLLDPREVCAAAVAAYQAGLAPLASVEGFVRQILGWREFARGLYWFHMPQYLEDNGLGATGNLPAFYWTGRTDLHCLHVTIEDTLAHGYAHHIQRLMVTGLFALLYGVEPKQVHQWYLAVYVDAVEWVELPNTIGMSQHADGGLMGSKPYVASGRYIQRMGNYCDGCRYHPAARSGERACPFTVLYWDFLARHRGRFATHPRLKMQFRNLARLEEAGALTGLREEADALRGRLAAGG